MKASNLVQYFDHDLLGAVPFKDRQAGCQDLRAHPRDIRLGVKMSDAESRETRAQIADDININRGESPTGIRKRYRYQ